MSNLFLHHIMLQHIRCGWFLFINTFFVMRFFFRIDICLWLIGNIHNPSQHNNIRKTGKQNPMKNSTVTTFQLLKKCIT